MSIEDRTAAAVGVVSALLASTGASGPDRARLQTVVESMRADLFADGTDAAAQTMAQLVQTTLIVASLLSGRTADQVWPVVAHVSRVWTEPSR